MYTAIVIAFFGLLILGVPISVMLLMVTGMALFFFTQIPLVSLIQQLYGGLNNFVILAVPFFIVAGGIMSAGDSARRIVDVINLVVGRLRGGMAISTIFGCMFFAAISGSSLATIIAIGTIMVPALNNSGYPKKLSTGVITSSGALGTLIPPSIPMILICIVMNTSVGEQFMAGFLPGAFIGLALSVYVYFLAKRYKWGRIKKHSFSEAIEILKKGSMAIVLPVIVLGGIYGGLTTPTEAGALALVYALIIELLVFKKLKPRDLMKVVVDSAVISAALTLILTCAFALNWFLTMHRVPVLVAEFITNHVSTKWMFLLIINILLIIMGTFVELITLIMVIGPILVPTLETFDISLIHFGIIMIVNAEVGYMTPPFGLNIFVSMSVTKQTMWEVAKAVFPFMLIFMGCLFIFTYIPQISTFLPNLFLH